MQCACSFLFSEGSTKRAHCAQKSWSRIGKRPDILPAAHTAIGCMAAAKLTGPRPLKLLQRWQKICASNWQTSLNGRRNSSLCKTVDLLAAGCTARAAQTGAPLLSGHIHLRALASEFALIPEKKRQNGTCTGSLRALPLS